MKDHFWPENVDEVGLRDSVAADIDDVAEFENRSGRDEEEMTLIPPRRHTGSQLTKLPRHTVRTAASIDELLADERDR